VVSLKQGVSVRGMSPQILLAVIVAESVYREKGSPLVLTSVCDGNHSHGSLHYQGNAVDLRIWGMDQLKQREVHAALSTALGHEYDVVLETDHIHVEWQPKNG